MKINRLITALFVGIFLAACSSDDPVDTGLQENRKIELSFSVPAYSLEMTNGTRAIATRATDVGSDLEKKIDNLYVFLFPTAGTQTLMKYYIDAATFSGGTWSTTDKKVTLNLTQAEAGNRNVYVVVNCADLKTALDGVVSSGDLESVFRTTAAPWAGNIQVPILMVGNATNNFLTNYQLNSVPLTRAIAKIELNVELSSGFQVAPTGNSSSVTNYRYRYANFDMKTYVLKPASKTPAIVSSGSDRNPWPTGGTNDWTAWGNDLAGSADTGTNYTLDGISGKVTGLRIITYLNERDEAGAQIEIELPRADGGLLPPPEFGPERYSVTLPDKIERNKWYRYSISI